MAQQSKATTWQKLEKWITGNSEYAKYNIDQNFAKNIDPADYEAEKLEKQQTAYLQSQWRSIDSELYQKAVFYEPTRIASYYDYESMEYSVAGDSGVPTPDGIIKIEDLAAKGRDHEFLTYAYDFNREKLVPAKAYNAHKSRDEFTYKITFDDDSYIIATPDHRFLKRNGQFEMTKNLQPGDSMMPFYRKSFFNNQNYNWVYTCNSKEGHHGWVPEHNLIAEEFDRPLQENEEVHHKDFNGKNNDPSNLQIMDKSEHRAYHARLNNEKLWADPQFREKMKRVARSPKNFSWNGQRKGSGNPSYIDLNFNEIVNSARKNLTIFDTANDLNVSYRKLQNELTFYGFQNWKDFLKFYGINSKKKEKDFRKIPWDLIVETAKEHEKLNETAKALNISLPKLRSTLKSNGFNNWTTFCKAYGIQSHNKEGRGALNHKIKSIEPYGVIPVYDLTVPGHKNFATDTIISHNTPEISAALDIYSEEATTPDEFGRMLQIYSESEQIKNELEDLFYNKLDINANLPPWIRNTPIRKDSIIPLLNGTEDEIQNISKRVNEGEEVWTYSVQDNTKQIKPGKIVWCGLTRENSSMVRVTLDDNTCIDSTPDHEFMLRNGSYKRADKLQENDSLMPFYTYKSDGQFYGYEKVYNPKNRHYKYSHRMVAHECIRDKNYEDSIDNDFLTHHIDFNKLNNHPNNLQRMTFSEHEKLHETLSKIGSEILQRPDVKQKRYEALQKFLRSDYRRRQQSQKYEGHYPEDFKKYNNSNEHRKHNHIRKETTQSIWDDPTKREQRKESMRVKFDDYVWTEIENAIERGDIKFRKDVVPYINKNLFNHILSINKNRRLHNKGKISERIFLERIKDYGYNTPKEYLDSKTECILNHKVKSVEFLSETDDVYCMEIHGPNGERDRHNFPVCGKDLNGNYDRNNGAFISNCKYGDNFVYLKMFPKKGIVDVSQLPNMEITRVEPDFQKITKLNSFEQEQNIQFQWRNKDLHFNSFEIAHFRLLGDDRRLPYGTCCVSGTYVNTSLGCRKIEEVNIGDDIKFFDKSKQEFNASTVKDIVCNGQKPYYYVKTRHNSMNLTGNHVVITFNPEANKFEDKFTSDLQNGDYLIIQPNEPNGKDIPIEKTLPEDYNKSQNYSEKNRFWNDIDSIIPDYVNEDFAKLFGYLMGDGSLDKNNNTISLCLSEHKEINKKYIKLSEQFSGRKDNVINEEDYGENYRIYSKMLMTILERMGFNGNAYTKEIPYWLFDAKPDIQKAFIDGIIDSDGSMYIDQWDCCRYEIELANEKLVNGLKQIIQQIGWKSGKISSRKRDNVTIKGNEVRDAKTTYSFYFWKKELTNNKKDYNKIQTNNYIVEKIEDIQYNDTPEYVYDIYVENENHNFVANGIVVHNSILEKARRIWKQLMLAEDAMMVYRTCLVGDSRVATNNGYKYIKDINEGDKIYSMDKEERVYPNIVKSKQEMGTKPVYKVQSKHKEIIGTDNHPILVKDQRGNIKYVDIKDIEPKKHRFINPNFSNIEKVPKRIPRIHNEGWVKISDDLYNEFRSNQYDSIRQKLNETEAGIDRGKQFVYGSNQTKALPAHQGKEICEKFNLDEEKLIYVNKNEQNDENLYLPDYVTEDFARLFGFLLGDGYMRTKIQDNGTCYILGFAEGEHEEINQKYFNLLKQFYGNNKYAPENRENRRYGKYRASNKTLVATFEKLGFKSGAHNKRIPEWVFSERDEIKKALIEGLADADGTNRYTKAGTWFSTIELCNKNLIEDIKEVWDSIGYCSGLIKSRCNKGGFIKAENRQIKETKSYSVTISDYVLKDSENILNVEYYGEEPVYDIGVKYGEPNFIVSQVPAHNSRAPERRIYKIYVGNMDDNDVNQYVDKIANEFKRSKVTDASTGNMDTRYNQLAVDQDYFIPVRDPNQASPIETLPGADNLSEIADIQYVQRKLFTALRVPKTFLGFDEDVGEGKNLALMDIRFSRAIHRVQKSIVQELNKIALIHLYLRGYKDDLENFELGLTSPSTQADLLQLEGWQQKMDIYKASVEKVNNGMSAMSATKAKKEILGMSDEEIRLDLQRQAVEEAANQEMDAISEAVVETGVFNTLYDIYNIRPEEETAEEESGEEDGEDEGGSIGGSAGGSIGDIGGEDEGGEDEGGEETEEPEGEELSEQRRKIDLREVKQQKTRRINLQESKSKNQHRIKNMMEEIDNLFNEGDDTRDVLNENENKNYDENDNE